MRNFIQARQKTFLRYCAIRKIFRCLFLVMPGRSQISWGAQTIILAVCYMENVKPKRSGNQQQFQALQWATIIKTTTSWADRRSTGDQDDARGGILAAVGAKQLRKFPIMWGVRYKEVFPYTSISYTYIYTFLRPFLLRVLWVCWLSCIRC